MGEQKTMGKPREETPDQWSPIDVKHVPGSDDIYVGIVGDGIEVGKKADNVWIYHYHMPTEGAHRWSLSACGLHDVQSVEPLTLFPSLACEDGCPSHGFITNGVWTNA